MYRDEVSISTHPLPAIPIEEMVQKRKAGFMDRMIDIT